MGHPVNTPEPLPAPELLDTGGTTPRGFPYPGPDSQDSGIASYLQSLAESITAALGSAGTGYLFAYFSLNVTIESDNYGRIQVPTIRDVKGAVCVCSTQYSAILTVYPHWDPAINTHPEDWQGVVRVFGEQSKWSGVGTVTQPSLPPGTVFGCYGIAWGTPWG
jgi:hypothetical protein